MTVGGPGAPVTPADPTADLAVQVDRVTAGFSTRRGLRPSGDADFLVVLQELTFGVPADSLVCILGPSGCGKSTLLNLALGLKQAESGRILVTGREVTGPSADVSMVFQAPNLLPWRTVLRNVTYGMESALELSRAEGRDRALGLLETVGLTDFVNAYPAELSGGMQQRVNLARALACQPKLLLLDEPFAALDAQLRERMQRELLSILGKHRTTGLFVTHDVREAAFLADQVVVLTARPSSVFRVFGEAELGPRSSRDATQIARAAEQLDDALRGAVERSTTGPAR